MSAEKGHTPNRAFIGQDGNIHLNGSTTQLDELGSNIAPPSFAAARTLTLPDPGGNAAFKLIQTTPGGNGLVLSPAPLTNFKAATGTTLPATAAGGEFGFAITLGASFALIGETSNNSSKTDDAIFEYVVPESYIAGQNLTVTVNCQVTTAGAPTYGTKTVQVKAYPVTAAGVMAADIGPGAATALNGTPTVAQAIPFTITGTSLVPGQRIVFEVESVLHDTGGVACNMNINSVLVG